MSDPIRDMAGLVEALRQRRDALDISHETIDEISGLQSGYAGKLLAPRAPRNLSYNSLGLILGALGVGLQVVEDQEQIAKVAKRWQKRKPQGPRYKAEPQIGQASIETNLQKLAELLSQLSRKERIMMGASIGGKRRAKALGKRQRARIAAHAARQRWAKRDQPST